jgi:hypothetical protein
VLLYTLCVKDSACKQHGRQASSFLETIHMDIKESFFEDFIVLLTLSVLTAWIWLFSREQKLRA